MEESSQPTSFKSGLTTGDFILQARIESVNRDLEIGSGAGAWQRTRILFINLPLMIKTEVREQFQQMTEKINTLLMTPQPLSPKQLSDGRQNSPYMQYVNKGKNVNNEVCNLVIEFLDRLNVEFDKHDFRWLGRRQLPYSTVDLSERFHSGNGES